MDSSTSVADILDEWPMLRGRTSAEWAMFVRVLRDKGRVDAACRLARLVLQRADCDGRARQFIGEAFRTAVPSWHWGMIHDSRRNDCYDAALRRAVGRDSVVLDIGSGSGLLAMMAARAGAAAVVSCEMNPVTAFLAKEIIEHNGYADRVRVAARHSCALVVGPGEDLERPADIIVSEIFGASLLEEGVLPAHADAASRLLRPGGAVIPAYGEIMVALGRYDPGRKRAMGIHNGFDLSLFNLAAPPSILTRTDNPFHRILSDAAPLFRFDLARPAQWPGVDACVEVTVAEDGANAILQWIRLTMDNSGAADAAHETRPDPTNWSSWGVRVFPLAQSQTAAAGARVRIRGLRSDNALMIWLKD